VKGLRAQSRSRQRSKPSQKGLQENPEIRSGVKVRPNISRQHDLNKIDALCSPGSPYPPRKVGSSREREETNGFGTLNYLLDTRSMDSDAEECHIGFDRYTSVEGSPIKKRKSENKENLVMTPTANPLHRLPLRMSRPGWSGRKESKDPIKSPTAIDKRKEQVKRDIATTLASMKEDELGNIMYNPRSETDVLANTKAKIFRRAPSNMNNHGGLSSAVPKYRGTRLDMSNNKDVQRKDLKETSHGRKDVSCNEKGCSVKPRFALWSQIRMSAHKILGKIPETISDERVQSTDYDQTEPFDKKVDCEEK